MVQKIRKYLKYLSYSLKKFNNYLKNKNFPTVKQIIEIIESLLTSDQLKKLELSGLGETFSFKDRMMVAYGDMYPIFSLDTSKEKAQHMIDGYESLFSKGIEFHMNEELIRRFGYLFTFNKPSSEKYFLVN